MEYPTTTTTTSVYTHKFALVQTAESSKFLVQLSCLLPVVVPLVPKAGHSQFVNLPPEQHPQQKSENTNDNERLHFGHNSVLIKAHQEGVASTPEAMCSRESKRKPRGMSPVASQLKCSFTYPFIERPSFGFLKESGERKKIVKAWYDQACCDVG